MTDEDRLKDTLALAEAILRLVDEADDADVAVNGLLCAFCTVVAVQDITPANAVKAAIIYLTLNLCHGNTSQALKGVGLAFGKLAERGDQTAANFVTMINKGAEALIHNGLNQGTFSKEQIKTVLGQDYELFAKILKL